MSTRVKAGIYLALFVVLFGAYMYMTWGATLVVAKQWNALGPIRWIDFASGAFVMFIVMLVLFVSITLRETTRFDREVGGDGGQGGGSGGGKKVRMLMSHRVVDIAKWDPPKGQYHRGVTAPA